MPVRNTPPVIDFRYRSNPLGDTSSTHFTFPTRTFVWGVTDDDARRDRYG